jgi:hypothetical protein
VETAGSNPLETPTAGNIRFACHGCGTILSIPAAQAHASGPCPTCKTWLTGPAKPKTLPGPPLAIAPKPTPSHPSSPQKRRGKGHLMADSMIDHQHLEQRETLRTIKVIAFIALALSFCLAVAWFMKGWASQ